MTKLLEQAIETATRLPPDMQDEIARMMLLFAGKDEAPISLTTEEEAALERSEAAAASGEFATDDQLRAIWAKYGL